MSQYTQEALKAGVSKHFLTEPYSKYSRLCRPYGLLAITQFCPYNTKATVDNP